MMRVVVGMVDSDQGRPGLGTNRQSQGWGLGRLGFPERRGGVWGVVVGAWVLGSTEES